MTYILIAFRKYERDGTQSVFPSRTTSVSRLLKYKALQMERKVVRVATLLRLDKSFNDVHLLGQTLPAVVFSKSAIFVYILHKTSKSL
jgi:hypothetical protein